MIRRRNQYALDILRHPEMRVASIGYCISDGTVIIDIKNLSEAKDSGSTILQLQILTP